MPFVTILRAQDGRIAAYSVTSAPWPPDVPELPERRIVHSNPTPAVSPPTQAPAPAAQPLFFSGKKSKPDLAPKTPDSSSSVAPGSVPLPAPERAGSADKPVIPQEPLDPGHATTGQTISPANQPFATADPKAAPQQAVPIQPVETAIAQPASSPPGSNAGGAPTASTASKPPPGVEAVASQNSFNAMWLWLALLVLLGAISGLCLLWVRRSRAVPQASLITKSLDREKKE